MMKYEILCYGDSDTHGRVGKWSDTEIERRYDRDTRWPCVLQKELGEDYAVVEEGLGGRTSMYSDAEGNILKNGLLHLEGYLASHKPLDLVILFLGSNDLQLDFINESNLADGMKALIEKVQSSVKVGPGFDTAPEVLFIGSPEVIHSSPAGRTSVWEQFKCEGGGALSKKFPQICENVAKETGCWFLDSQKYATPSLGDGVHITGESHIKLGKAIAQKVREIRKNGICNRT